MNKNQYHVWTGTVQNYVVRTSPFFMYHFGKVEYDMYKPILTDSLRIQGQVICDELNSGQITEDEAKKRLDRIYY